MAAIPLTSRRIRLLLWKNLLMRRRHWIITSLEIILPTLLSILLVYIRTSVDFGEAYVQFPPDENGETGFPLISESELTIRFATGNWCENSTYYPRDCIIAYAPTNDLTNQLVEDLVAAIHEISEDGIYFTRGFDTERELELYHQRLLFPQPGDGDETWEDILAAVVFQSPSVLDPNGNIAYKIRTQSYMETKDLFPVFQDPAPEYYHYSQYNYGFSGLQILLDKILIRYFTGVRKEGLSKFQIHSQAMPYPKYPTSDLNQIYQFIMPQFIVQGFIFMVPSIVRAVVAEKETGIKELMRLMGLANWMHWVGWLVNSLLVLIISVTVIVVLFFVPFSSDSGAVLIHGDPTLWWVVLFLFALSATAWCFFVSAFFQKPTLAMTVGIILWIALYQPIQILLEPKYGDLSLADKLGTCLLPNMAVHFALLIMCGFEAKGVGSKWSNVGQSLSANDSLTLAHVMGMFLLNTALYILLASYIENVIPSTYGVRKPFYYIFMPSTWYTKQQSPSEVEGGVSAKRSANSAAQPKQTRENGFEEEPHGLPVGIDIQGLRKVFDRSKVAVEELTVKMYHGQITALLGHNGAGKSTTISMITGMYAPSSGRAFVGGYNIRSDLAKVRERLGLCPQHNMLFNKLTVAEHLLFFGRLKGFTEAEVKKESEALLRQLQLEEKKNVLSASLSGGQKRKLSLGCALIGRSKVVVLDEPTSGMDPEARRVIWNLLLELRGERTILLTTHFMEEADVLGDRIAIMSHGRLKCCGSAMFLKQFYGAAYTLSLGVSQQADKQAILASIRRHLPDAYIKSQNQAQSATELAIVLPINSTNSSVFVPLFKDLSNGEASAQIKTVGLSLTTMDEVFVRVGELGEGDGESVSGEYAPNFSETGPVPEQSCSNSNEEVHRTGSTVTGVAAVVQQFWGLLLKRILYTSRKWRHLIAQLLIPVLLLIAAILVCNSLNKSDQSQPARTMRFGDYRKSMTVFRAPPESDTQAALLAVTEQLGTASHTVPHTGNLTRYLLDVGAADVGRYRDSYVVALDWSEGKSTEGDRVNVTALASTISFHANPLSINFASNAILARLLAEGGAGHQKRMTLQITNHPLQSSIYDVLPEINPDTIALLFSAILPVGLGLLAATYVIFAIEERKCSAKQLQLMTGTSPLTYWSSAFLCDYTVLLMVVSLMVACFPIFQVDDTYTANGGAGVAFLILAVFGFGAISFSYLLSLFVGSVPGGFALVSIIHIFMGLVQLALLAIGDSPTMKTLRDTLRWIGRLVPSFGAGAASYHYAWISASNSVCNQLDENVKELICTPGFDYGYYASEFQSCCDNCQELGVDCFETTPYLQWEEKEYEGGPSEPRIVQELMYMVIMGLIYKLILAAIELGLFTKLKARIFAQNQEAFRTSVEDEDVLAEVDRVNGLIRERTQERNAAMVLQGLSKSYGSSFAAVSNLTFGVHHGECFGLLGVNGAGKTTTFRMLTGDEVKAGGNAWAHGTALDGDRTRFLSGIGYCPQFDGLIGVLTGREMLQLFCRLRGVPRSRVDAEADKWLRRMGLADAASVQCRKYSGGMKRRLSAAMAIVGDPPILFLDEPTSGVDPVARRQFWQVIRDLRRAGQAVVLTSHSMEECEALCDRLGIMVNGELQCLGGVEHLKNKFAHGYTLTMKLKQGQGSDFSGMDTGMGVVADLNREISNRFNPCTLRDQNQSMLQYQIHNTNMPWDVVFQIMEDIKSRYPQVLEEYSVSGTTLEAVFLSFARKQYVAGRTANVSTFKKLLTCQCFGT